MSEQKSISEQWGHDFLRTLYHMTSTVRMYQDNNQIVRTSVESFHKILHELTNDGDISLRLNRGRFHLGGEKIPYRRDAAVVVYNMVDFFSKRSIGSLTFLTSSRDVPPEKIMTLARLLNEAVKHDRHVEWLEEQLTKNDFSWVQIQQLQDEDIIAEGENLEEKKLEKARKNYFQAIEAVKEVANKVSHGTAGVRRIRRLAQNIVDLTKQDAALMIGLTTLKDYDDYTYIHSVNVALLAACLGRHIELSDIVLEHLTICGLFHDLGKVDVPKEILFKQGELTNGEWDTVKKHPVMGVKKILMLNANPSLRSKIILGPFEHHLNLDMTGYPQTLFINNVSLMGKIIHIADVYEAMTSARVYRPKSFMPDEVLKEVWKEAGTSFDTILLKRFIHMMGTYPIGSVVEINNGSFGVVIDYPEETERSLPLIMLLEDDGKGTWQSGKMIYLADQNSLEVKDRLNILRTISPEKFHIHPAEFFLRLK